MNRRETLGLALLGALALWAISRSRSTITETAEGAVMRATNYKNSATNEEKYRPIIAAAEVANGIPTGMLHRLIKTESSFRQDVIDGSRASPVGALGIAQFMPATAREWGINPLDPLSAISGAGRYLAWLARYFKGDWQKAVASYNWGIGNVAKAATKYGTAWATYAPPETRSYLLKVYA